MKNMKYMYPKKFEIKGPNISPVWGPPAALAPY
jgi:hypothetical protein